MKFLSFVAMLISFCVQAAPADYNTSTTSRVVIPGVKESYTFTYSLKTNPSVPVAGFSCDCVYNGMSGKWAGSGTDACGTGASKPYPVSGLTLPTGACCSSKPKVDTTVYPAPSAPTACWY